MKEKWETDEQSVGLLGMSQNIGFPTAVLKSFPAEISFPWLICRDLAAKLFLTAQQLTDEFPEAEPIAKQLLPEKFKDKTRDSAASPRNSSGDPTTCRLPLRISGLIDFDEREYQTVIMATRLYHQNPRVSVFFHLVAGNSGGNDIKSCRNTTGFLKSYRI